MRKVFFLPIVLFLAGCSGLAGSRSTATPVTKITMEQAQRIALNIGKSGGFDIRTESSAIQIISTELIPLKVAYGPNNHVFTPDEDPNALVWYVRLKGLWRDAFPRPKEHPTSEAQQYFFVIINSETGDPILSGTSVT
jgi:hypothetical protein